MMASPLSSDIPKPFGSTDKLVHDVNQAFAMPVPAFGDLGKAANDVRLCLAEVRPGDGGEGRRWRADRGCVSF